MRISLTLSFVIYPFWLAGSLVYTVSPRPPGSSQEADFSKISFKAIVSLHDSRDWGTELSVASEILQAENGVLGTRRTNFGNGQGDVEVVFCNPDLLWGK